jgi:hypothetical protein
LELVLFDVELHANPVYGRMNIQPIWD